MPTTLPNLAKLPRHWSRVGQPTIVDVHALHKSATMFLFKFFGHLAKLQAAQFRSDNKQPADSYGPIDAEFFENLNASRRQTIFRAPIRTFNIQDHLAGEGVLQRRIFHLRDPRDMLVSEYFSFGWIHPSEGGALDARRAAIQEMSVDQYVLRQSEESSWPLEEKYAALADYEFDPNRETVVKYEQMVTDFPRWCRQVLLGAGVGPVTLLTARLAWRYRREFRASEEAMSHKRRITPGDFRDKLKPETIRVLNQRFATILERFEYL